MSARALRRPALLGEGSRTVAPPGGRGKLRTARLTLVLAAALAPLLVPARAAAQLPPDEPWRTLDTEHFRVTFPARLDSLARHAGARAEGAWSGLATIVPPPDGRIDLVLTDHVDHTNGYASVSPRRRIVVYARPPADGLGLGYYDDWMELVITHELAHVFQFETAGPIGRTLRRVFGRVPAPWPFFPNQGVPAWVSEGLAVYYESAFTPSGRGEGTYHAMILRTAALEGKLEEIDAASGLSPIWPTGDRPYVYGSQFFEWLTRRHDPREIAAFVRAIGNQIVPYRFNDAARDAFGNSLSNEWRVWKAELEADARATRDALAARAPLTVPESVAPNAYYVLAPRVSPDGTRLAFARADGLTDPQIRVAAPDGSGGRRLARTNDASFFTWMRDGSIVLAQLDYADPYRLYGDLWRVRADGSTSRVTEGARLDHPAAERDGRHLLAVRTAGGATEIVRVHADSGSIEVLVPAEPGVAWSFPAPSPDGRFVAAARHRDGRSFDLVLLDPRTGRLLQEVTRDRAVDTSPTWSSDGHFLLWSSDRSGIPNVFAVAIDAQGRLGPIKQVTNVVGGVAYPAVDPEMRWIYLAGYHANGWAVERVPFDPSRWFEPLPLAPLYAEPSAATPAPAAPTAPSRAYSAAETLRPLYWQPQTRGPLVARFGNGKTVEVLGPTLGFFTEAADVVGRHSVALSGEWSTSGGRFLGGLSYSFFGLAHPALGLRLTQSWDATGPFLGQASPPAVDTLYRRDRERAAAVGATFLLPDFRVGAALNASAGIVETRRELLDRDLRPSAVYALDEPTSRLADLGLAASLSTARAHSFSISREEGAALALRMHARRDLERAVADDSYREAIGEARGFLPLRALGLGGHVLALRGAAGVARGPGADRFHFDVGGAAGQAEALTGFGLFGDAETFPLRGYASGFRSGREAWSASAEYRFPIARLNRGIGLVPVNLEAIHADLFADAGDAWGPAPSARGPVLWSYGAELSFDTFLMFSTRVPLRFGVARPRTGDPLFYLRFGASF